MSLCIEECALGWTDGSSTENSVELFQSLTISDIFWMVGALRVCDFFRHFPFLLRLTRVSEEYDEIKVVSYFP